MPGIWSLCEWLEAWMSGKQLLSLESAQTSHEYADHLCSLIMLATGLAKRFLQGIAKPSMELPVLWGAVPAATA